MWQNKYCFCLGILPKLMTPKKLLFSGMNHTSIYVLTIVAFGLLCKLGLVDIILSFGHFVDRFDKLWYIFDRRIIFF